MTQVDNCFVINLKNTVTQIIFFTGKEDGIENVNQSNHFQTIIGLKQRITWVSHTMDCT